MKNWNSFFLKLRIKRSLLSEGLLFFSFIFLTLISLIGSYIWQLSRPQPIIKSEMIYREATRLSFRSSNDETDFKGSSFEGYISSTALYKFESKDTRDIYQIDSSSILAPRDLKSGRLPKDKSEAVLGVSSTIDTPPFVLANLINDLALPTTYEIVGVITLPPNLNSTVFIHLDLLELTTRNKVYTENILIKDQPGKTKVIFDSSLPLETVRMQGELKEVQLDFFEKSQVFQVTSSLAKEDSITINPNAFDYDRALHNYRTIVFDSFKDKLDFLERNELEDIKDSFFSPIYGNMTQSIKLDYPLYSSALHHHRHHRHHTDRPSHHQGAKDR